MKSSSSHSCIEHAITGLAIIMVVGTLILPFARGAITWTGPSMGFTNQTVSDQGRITPEVWLTRGSSQGIFNSRSEAAFQHFFSPANTEWANGTIASYTTLSYTDWNTWAKTWNGGPPNTVGTNAVVHLISEDIYLGLKFTSWPSGGGFSYVRSTPSAAPVPPAVTEMTTSGDGTFQFTFTNTPGYLFTILGSTNLSLPLTDWQELGPATYSLSGPGSYLFADPGAGTNQPQRYYRVRWP
jgi:hypothetical protein